MPQKAISGYMLPPAVEEDSSRVNLLALLKQLSQRKSSEETTN